ncbi:MAG: Chaperone protein HtpG [Chlamydiae bacterium]|nr:Chaperone protein HtpG [Chlamydiota bacterium]
MVQGTLKINTEKLLPIIKKWLYSDKEIFLRELVSNACDALSKLKILREQKEIDFADEELKIAITLDKEKKTLTITDTGIGMTADEVEKYIAQLAFSGAEEFLSKYKSEQEKDQVIGHFGLGFYSAYMVASNIEIDTLSFQKSAEPAFWVCDGTSSYTLDKGSREKRGTTITLHIEEEEFLELSRIQEILQRYCAFLPYPIYLNEEHINHKDPLWLKSPADCTEKEYLEFYRQLHPLDPDPIFWVHLNIDYPFHLKGILYFPHIHQRFDFQKSPIKLFCNRVFVSDNCQDLIPEYLTVMRGAIDSPDIPLNVSRSFLQMDKTVRSLSNHISKKVADRLATLYRTDSEKFISHWEDVETIIKLGIIHDDKFYDRVKDFLIWKNLDGEWTTLPEYLERHPDKIFYTQDTESPFLQVYKEKKIEVLIAKGPLDIPLMNFLELKLSPAKFQRIDGGLDPSILDSDREKSLLDTEGKTESSKIADFVRSSLDIKDLEVEAKSLASDQLPAFLMLDEQTRRLRDTFALSSKNLPPGLADKKTFVVNTNSPIITALAKHPDKELSKEVLTHLYQLSQLSQKELPPKELSHFIARSTKILEKFLNEEV